MNTRDWSNYKPHSKTLGQVYVDALSELALPYPSIKLPGWDKLNQLMGGFRTNEFTILCGSTGTGKTTLLANWARALLQANVKSFVMSVETGAVDFTKRTMSAFLGRDINQGDAVPVEQLREFDLKHGKYFKSDGMYLSLYDNRIKHSVVMEEILFHHEVYGCELVFIDNLNFLMEVVSQNRAIEEMDRVVHDLIMLCKRTKIHLVMVMHPKKTGKDGERVESEFDIKGSSTAVQEAQNVLLFNRPKESDELTPYHRDLKIQKMRRKGQNTGSRLIMRSIGSQYLEEEVRR